MLLSPSPSSSSSTTTQPQWPELPSELLSSVPPLDHVSPVEKQLASIVPSLKNEFKTPTSLSSVVQSLHSRSITLKDETKANDYKEQGNKYFGKKLYKDSVLSYTNAIGWSLFPSSLIGVCCYNRSTALFHLGKFKECIDDATNAVNYGYPEIHLYKVYNRRGQAFLSLKVYSEALKDFQTALSNCIQFVQDKDSIKSLESNIQQATTKLHGNSPNSSNAKDSGNTFQREGERAISVETDLVNPKIKMKYEQNVGRYLITEGDINLGERIVVEKPYAAVLGRDHNLTRCHHCFKLCYSLLPCEICPFSLYCSPKCKKEASLYYHKMECAKSIFQIAPTLLILGLRIMQRKLKEVGDSSPSSSENLDPQSSLPPSNYSLVHSFLPHYHSHSHHHLLKIIFDTIVMSHFIDNLDELTLIHHLCQTATNVYGVFDVEEKVEKKEPNSESSSIVSQQQVKIGEAIYCVSTLLNHSCQPNTLLEYDGFQLSIIAKDKIKAGNEIFNCYGPLFGRLETSQRKKILQSQYFFDCKCTACSVIETKSSNFKEEKLKKSSQFLQKGRQFLQEFQDFNSQDKWTKAVDCFQKCKDLRNETLSEPNILLYEIEDALAESFVTINDFGKAAIHSKKSVLGLEKIYGKESLEVGLEWAKLARILFNAREIDNALETIKKSQRIIKNYRSEGYIYRETLNELQEMRKCLQEFLSR